ncbi:MAG: hypothetical protein WBE30_07660 [Candidatus Cybelea sp.]
MPDLLPGLKITTSPFESIVTARSLVVASTAEPAGKPADSVSVSIGLVPPALNSSILVSPTTTQNVLAPFVHMPPLTFIWPICESLFG